MNSVDHIGIAVTDLEASIRLYSESFGLTLTHREVLPLEQIEVAFMSGVGTSIELITTNKSDTPLGRSLASRGPGLHHLCFETTDIREELQRLEAIGHTLIDREPRIGSRGKLIAFLHPRTSGGALIELCQKV
jgi:methylmalonyl-CoA epimerase